MTDPVRGDSSESNKLEYARTAVELWWYVYAELMLWAQSQLAGYELGRANPDFMVRIEKKLGKEITPDSHLLEYLGLGFSFNRVCYDDELGDFVENELENGKASMDDASLRCLIRELLVSRSANSSFWRFDLQSALYALNLGHVEPLVKPEPTRRQGNPIQLLRWKVKALQHAHFLIGKGYKKYRALQTIGDGIGQSIETLRDWEKSIVGDDDLRMDLIAAQLAGEYEAELDSKSPTELRKLANEYHRNMSDIEMARYTLGGLRAYPLEAVKNGIRLERQSGGGRKRRSDTKKDGT